MAVYQTLRIPQNGIWQVTFAVVLANAPVDITGWTADMQIRRVKTSSTILAEFTTNPGGYITLDGPNGNILLDVPASVTLGYTFGSGVYDLYAGPYHMRIAEGNVIVDETATR
jgi:hypothetical protein